MRRVLAPFLLLCLAALTLPVCAPTSRWAGGDPAQLGSALVREAAAGDLAELPEIIAAGADPNWRAEPGGKTALMSAALAGHAEVVAFLLQNGADPTLRWGANGRNALELAQMNGHRDVVALLQGASQGLPPPGRLPPNADQTAPPARDD